MDKRYFIILVTWFTTICNGSSVDHCQSEFDNDPGFDYHYTTVLNLVLAPTYFSDLDVCFSKGYSEVNPPLNANKIDLKLDIIVKEILNVDDFDMTVEMSLILVIKWMDTRIMLREGVESIALSRYYRSKLWIPDLVIIRMVSFYQPASITHFDYLGIYNDHEVEYQIHCPFNFERFPFDSQICPMNLGSFSLNNETLKISGGVKVDVSEGHQRDLQYSLHIKPLKEEEKWQEINIGVEDETEFYSIHGFNIYLRRSVHRIIPRTFLPTGLLVMLSWISFVIEPAIVPGRMALLVTLLLVLINISNGLANEIPMSNSLTALEQWMLLCIGFVIGAIAEYSYILFLMVRDNKWRKVTTKNGTDIKLTPGKKADMGSLFVFPILYTVTNVVFWSTNLAY